MNCSLQKNGSVLFQEIDSFLAELIAAPFQQKELSSKILTDYFFQKLTTQDPLAAQDWKEYVAPELQELFTACHEHVLNDLALLQKENSKDRFHTLLIPAAHRDAWLRMLSMVRLSLTSHYKIREEELQEQDAASLSTPRGKALLQMEIFAVMQQCLIEQV